MTTTDTDDARYLELASRQGMESLRRECPCIKYICDRWEINAGAVCPKCQGRGWLPLPEAERLGALVRVAHTRDLVVVLAVPKVAEGLLHYEADMVRVHDWMMSGGCTHLVPQGDLVIGLSDFSITAALTEAFLAATKP